MRNRTRTIPLYSKLGTILRQIGHAEGAALEASGHASRMKRLVAGRYELVGYQLRALLTDEHGSPTSITLAEMEAMAGTRGASRTQGHSQTRGEDFVERAHNKIAMWQVIPLTNPTRASWAQ